MRSLQQAFLLDLTGGEPREPSRRAEVFKAPPWGTLEDRWHVYAHGYVARIDEALGNDYRAVRRIVGRDAFSALVERYLSACPPRSYDLAHAGDRLAPFLEGDVLAESLPFLPDLARLEWSMVEAFVARDRRPLSRQDLERMGSPAAAEIRLALHPSVSLIRSAWPLCDLWELWKLSDDDEVSLQVEGRPCLALVHRHLFRVTSVALEEEAARLVEAARAGVKLSDFWSFSGSALDDKSVRRLLESFARLVDRGVFVPAEGESANRKEEEEEEV